MFHLIKIDRLQIGRAKGSHAPIVTVHGHVELVIVLASTESVYELRKHVVVE